MEEERGNRKVQKGIVVSNKMQKTDQIGRAHV